MVAELFPRLAEELDDEGLVTLDGEVQIFHLGWVGGGDGDIHDERYSYMFMREGGREGREGGRGGREGGTFLVAAL